MIECSSISSYLGGFSSTSALISVDGVEEVSEQIFPGLQSVQNAVKKDQLIEYNIMQKQMLIRASTIMPVEMTYEHSNFPYFSIPQSKDKMES